MRYRVVNSNDENVFMTNKLKLVKEKVRGLSIRQTDLKNKIDNAVDLLTSRFIGSVRKRNK